MCRTMKASIAVALAVGFLGCAPKEKTSLKIYVQQKLYDKAIEQGKLALQQNPQDGDTHYFLGAAYYGKDNDLATDSPIYADSSTSYLGQAYSHFMQAKKLAEANWGASADDNVVSMFGRHYNRGVIATKNGDPKTAAIEYGLAATADPENYKGFYARASAEWEMLKAAQAAKNEAEAQQLTGRIVQDLDKVLELDPGDKDIRVSVYQTKGDVLYKRGDTKGAQDAYKQAVQLSPENYTLIETVADRFYNESAWEDAAAYYQDALSLKERLNLIGKDDAATYAALGNALTKLDRRDEAAAQYEKALALVPNDPANMYNLMVTHYKAGDAAEKAGDMAAAKQRYMQAITLGDQLISVDDKRSEYWQVRGLCKRGVGDFAGAARDLKKYQELHGGGSTSK
jgi:tetratricopeptide (TPR) repeat protein